MEWQPIETAPRSSWNKTIKLILWNEDANCACLGRVLDCGDGDYCAIADGYNGDWKITHWMPLPKPPEE